MQLSIGFSPCPNDTFIFYAILNNKINTYNIEYQWVMDDVETLNQRAFGESHLPPLDISKLSYHALAYVLADYRLLNAGSALGNRCGPLLICKQQQMTTDLHNNNVVIPGKFTTANFLLQFAYPQLTDCGTLVFSEIENALLKNQAAAGVIIHENRFTYQQRGLQLICDLGEYWEQTTGFPIPLGGIAINRNLPTAVQKTVDKTIRESLEYAYCHTDEVLAWVRQFAQEMDEAVMLQHIRLYVNDYSLKLGETGRAAVRYFLQHIPASATWTDDEIFV
ncbi:MAG: 1,4-dihydroxy-6-naphthoate synthase [Saprospiraceae bacterium]|nr:1,4-dihydroxy-6-naphthoate synthase [Saprospiraceae bacterium]MBP7679769.1 1,4-dihydroxy-6-naphthoate synthase [Saprospiraceae bacterium]